MTDAVKLATLDVTDNVTLIVGGGRGIGRAAAKLLAAAGSHVVAAARTESELLELEVEVERENPASGGSLVAQTADVADGASLNALVKTTLDRFGQLDTLIYAAGVGVLKPFGELSEADFSRMMEVNTLGAFRTFKEVLPVMERQKRGRVVTIPGILGRAPMAAASGYAASKYALTGMVKCLALEYKRFGIRFSLLHLGGVNSPFWDDITMRVQRDKMLTVDEAARAVFFAATQPGEGVVNEIIIQPESHQM